MIDENKHNLTDKDLENEIPDEFSEITAPLLDRVGHDGMEKITLVCLFLARDNRPFFTNLLERSPFLIDRLLTYGGQSLVFDVYGLAAHLAGNHPSPAATLLDKSPDLLERIGYSGLKMVAHLAGIIAGHSWGIASKLIETSPYLIDSILKYGDISLVTEVLSLAEQVALKKWNAVAEFLNSSPATIERLLEFGGHELVKEVYALVKWTVGYNSGIAPELIKKSPELIERAGYDGLQKITGIIFRISGDNDKSAVSLLEKSPSIIDRLLNFGSRELVMDVFDLVFRIETDNASVTEKLFEKSPDIIERSGFDGLKEITRLCCRIEKAGWEIAVSFIEASPCIFEKVGLDGLEDVADLVNRTGRECCRTGVNLCKKSPEIIDRVLFEGLKDVAALCLSFARDGSNIATRLLEKSPRIIDDLLKRGGPALFKKVYNLICEAANENSRIALALLEKSPEIIDRVHLNGLKKIIGLSFGVARDSWTTADSMVKMCARIIDRVGYDGLKQVSNLVRLLARENAYGAVSLLEKSPALMERLSAYGGRSLVMDVYKISADIAPVNWTAAVTLLEKSPDLIDLAGVQGLKRVAETVTGIVLKNAGIAVSVLGVSCGLIERVDIDGFSAAAAYYGRVGRENREGAVTLLDNCFGIIDRLLKLGDRSLVIDVYRLAGMIADKSSKVSICLLEKSADYVELAGYDGLETIARRALGLAEINEEGAASFAKGESIEFADFVENIPKGLELRAVKSILSSYLAALLGYRIEIEEGDNAYTDGRRIYLPKRVREFQEDEKNFIYYKVISTHQEAHLEYGSFEFEIMEVEDSVRRIEDKYGRKSTTGESDIEKYFQLFPEPEMIRDLFNTFEDFRIETRLKKDYPILGQHIEFVNGHNLKKRPSFKKLAGDKQKAVEAVTRAFIAGRTENSLDDTVNHVLKTALSLGKPLSSSLSTVYGSVRAATDLYLQIDSTLKDPYMAVKPLSKPVDQALIDRNIGSFGRTSRGIDEKLKGVNSKTNKKPGDKNDGKEEPSGETTPSSSQPEQDKIPGSKQIDSMNNRAFESEGPGGRYGPDDKQSEQKLHEVTGNSMKYLPLPRIEKLLREAFKQKGITPKEIERKIQNMKPSDIELFLNRLESMVRVKTELEKEKGTCLYHEWGIDINGYRENWSRIREQDVEGITPVGNRQSFYYETIQKYSGLLKRIRREFQIMKPEEVAKLKKQYDGDEIDLDAAVEYFIDRKTGGIPSEKNYLRTEKRRRDIAVVFLIDISRSTRGETIQCEKEALIIMSEALSEVGDAFSIFGFSGDNRDNVDFYTIKGFEENYNSTVRARLSAIDYRLENRDGTALRHAIAKLSKREEKTRLIILLSDGKPVDKEYSGEYAIEDTRMALMEAGKHGIKTFCITVDKSAAEYLPRMYSHSNWVVIDDVNKLPEKISRIYGGLTN